MHMIGFNTQPLDFTTLSNKIEHRLCELGQLVPNQFPMTQREVVRGGKTVGVYFCVHGPRSVKLTAICDLVKKVVVFTEPTDCVVIVCRLRCGRRCQWRRSI